MKQQKQTSPAMQQRRRYFIDRFVQGRLLISLILLEFVIFGVAMWFVYTDLQQHIDSSLYRVHQVQTNSLPVLLSSLLQVLPWIILLNVLVLIVVDKIWAGYIRRIVEELEDIFSDLKNLRIRPPAKIKGEHQVITQAKDWLLYEQQRNQDIRHLLDALPDDLNSLDSAGQYQLNEILVKIQQLLP